MARTTKRNLDLEGQPGTVLVPGDRPAERVLAEKLVGRGGSRPRRPVPRMTSNLSEGARSSVTIHQ